MKIKSPKILKSIQNLYDVLSCLYGKERDNKEVINITKVSKSYLSRLRKGRTDLIKARGVSFPPSRESSRLILSLNLEDYLEEILKDSNILDAEKKQLCFIIMEDREKTAKILWERREENIDDLYLLYDLFQDDPLIFFLMKSNLMETDREFQKLISNYFFKKLYCTDRFYSIIQKLSQNPEIWDQFKGSKFTEALTDFSTDFLSGKQHPQKIESILRVNDSEEMKRIVNDRNHMRIFDDLLSFYINDPQIRDLLRTIRDRVKIPEENELVVITRVREDNSIQSLLIGKKAKNLLKNYQEIILRKFYAGDISNENKLRIAVGKFINLWVNNSAFREMFYKIIPFTEMEPKSSFVVLQSLPSKKSIEPYFFGSQAKELLKIYNTLIVKKTIKDFKEK